MVNSILTRFLRNLFLFLTIFLFAACGSMSGTEDQIFDDPGSGDQDKIEQPVSPSPRQPEKSVSVYKYDSKTNLCLNDKSETGYNDLSNGTDAECVDFSEKDLSDKDFSNHNLVGANFENAVLHRIKLEGATIKGLNLKGVEVSSEMILQWLLTGQKPQVVGEDSGSDESNERKEDEEIPVIVEDPMIAESEGDSSEEEEADFQLVDISEFSNLAEFGEYLEGAKTNSDDRRLAAEILVRGKQLTRSLVQAKIRVLRSQKRVQRHRLKIARSVKKEERDLNFIDELLQNLRDRSGEIKSVRDEILSHRNEIKELAQIFKSQRIENRKISKILRLVYRMNKLGLDVSGDIQSEESYAAVVEALENEKSGVVRDLRDLQNDISRVKNELANLRDEILPMIAERKGLTGEIKELNQVIRDLVQKRKSGQDLSDFEEEKLAETKAEKESLRALRIDLSEKIAVVHQRKKAPREELNSYRDEKSQLKARLKETRERLREYGLLQKLSVLIAQN